MRTEADCRSQGEAAYPSSPSNAICHFVGGGGNWEVGLCRKGSQALVPSSRAVPLEHTAVLACPVLVRRGSLHVLALDLSDAG